MTSNIGSLEAQFRTEAAVDPANPVVGDMYYDTTNNRLMRYDGAKWTGLAFTTSTSTTTTSTSTSTTSTSSSTSTTSTSTSTTSTSTSITTSTSTSTSTSTTTTL